MVAIFVVAADEDSVLAIAGIILYSYILDCTVLCMYYTVFCPNKPLASFCLSLSRGDGPPD